MSETGIEKRIPAPLKEKGQYALAFGVIAVMLYVAGFPLFLLFFVGVLTFFIWKVFSAEGRNETRRIFEFYLAANEMLRDDDRRWYGFEINETIARGESIVRSMTAAPPLVYFGLGALYQKLGDHGSAVKNLAHVVEETGANESSIAYPTKELREYVRMLRKIERAPAEAPQTFSAIRSLERARKNRGNQLLEFSREQLADNVPSLPKHKQEPDSVVELARYRESGDTNPDGGEISKTNETILDLTHENTPALASSVRRRKPRGNESDRSPSDRKTISEVLHDIYDGNVQ